MAKKLISSFAVFALLLSLTALGFAQQGSESSVKGGLSGVVVDPTDAVVSGAKVTITGPTGDRSMQTDQEGRFMFQVLTPGFYSIKIEKEGFKATDIKQAEVVTGRTSSVSVKMELGSSSTVVEVSGATVTVDTTSTATDTNLTDTFYQSIPVGRGVTGLFYAAPGVASGGGTGTANPSIAGGTGLENNYVADGVSITDGGFGGIGVYSRMYGSLSTGINLSFVKEVQVKTGGFEAQYGKSTGGIVQIVTKSGSNQFHGSVGGYFAPENFEATRSQIDDFGGGNPFTQRFNLQGKILHQSNYDVDAQVGGHVPGLKDHLFFFGAFNPQWNTDHDQFAQYRNPSDLGTAGLTGPTQTALGNFDVAVKVYSYAGKGTFRLNDHHQFEVSAFGDPTYGDNNANGNGGPQTASKTTFDKLQYGTRNLVGRYNGTFSPTWLFNASFTWGHNNLNDTPFAPNVYQIQDYTQRNPCGAPLFNPDCGSQTTPLRGSYFRQGLGYYENTKGDNYGLNFDTQKTFNFLGQHNLSFGYKYDRSHYDGTKFRTGPTLAVDAATAAAVTNDPALQSALVANGTNASFQLRARGSSSCITNPVTGAPGTRPAEIYVPGLNAAPVVAGGRQLNDTCPDGGIGTYLLQVRGEFGNLAFKTTSLYHTVFAQDAWSPSKYVTINAGLRWEQQHVAGGNAKYTFNDNWSPRVGISVDPWGNRKTKVTANFGRYTEALPLDIAIRSLSSELDFLNNIWTPPTDGAGHTLINSDGTLDMSNFSVANNLFAPSGGISAQSFDHAFGKGTRSEYLDEYQLGFEHEFGNSGVIFTAHYTDRRIQRIIEDNAALSPEAYQNGLNQLYTISNVSKGQDLFHNPVQIDYLQVFDPVTGKGTLTPPAGCKPSGTNTSLIDAQATDSNGNIATLANGDNAFCIPNTADANGNQLAGAYGADGIPDGFVDPVRKYQAMEFEVNKSFSKGWQMRANYRIAKLQGNYEGSFRNDNGQNDPNISSLFDFTRGDFNLLGQQFVSGVLNTDVHHLANGFVSYTFANHLKGLTMGSSVHFQTGTPINNLYAHPAYLNAGEIPFCADNTANCPSARGSLGRTKDWGSVDYHVDYPFRITEGTRLRLGADLFNITNNKTQLRQDQFAQRSFGIGNADFGKPTGIGPSAVNGNTNPGYQRPFYARMSVKFEF
jgi:hypothetical protein